MARKKTRSKTSAEKFAEISSRHVSSDLEDDESPIHFKPKWFDVKNGSSSEDLITLLDNGGLIEGTTRSQYNGQVSSASSDSMASKSLSEGEIEICNGKNKGNQEKDFCIDRFQNSGTNSPANGFRPVSFYSWESCKPHHYSFKQKTRSNSVKKTKGVEGYSGVPEKQSKKASSTKRKLKANKRPSNLHRNPLKPRKEIKTLTGNQPDVSNKVIEKLDSGKFVVSVSSAEIDENGNEPSKQNVKHLVSDTVSNIETVVNTYWGNCEDKVTSQQKIQLKNFYGQSKTNSSAIIKQKLIANKKQSSESQSTCSEESFASGPVVSKSPRLVAKRKRNESNYSDPSETSPASFSSHLSAENSNSSTSGVEKAKKSKENNSVDKFLDLRGNFVVSSDSNSPSLTSQGTTLASSDCNFSLSSEEMETPSSSAQSSPSSQASITKYFKTDQGSAKKGNATENTASRNTIRRGARKSGKKLEQMYLDFGQKDFGHVTCPTCGMVYTKGQPDDEGHHVKFHKRFVNGLRFLGWKNERVLQEFVDGRIIMISPEDHHLHVKKVEEIRKIVDTELGFVTDSPFRRQEAKTFLFVSVNKRVVGCAVAVHIDKGYPVMAGSKIDSTPDRQLASWSCSTTPAPAQCGISRIWVFNQFRRKKIATRLVDCIRNHFMYGCNITKKMLAFSDPTPDGKGFAQAYSGTAEFLVFR